jgi:hypothetical protein
LVHVHTKVHCLILPLVVVDVNVVVVVVVVVVVKDRKLYFMMLNTISHYYAEDTFTPEKVVP